MQCTVDRSIEVLANTPGVLRELLRGLRDEWVLSDTGPETFSPFDVVGHLLHGERCNWIDRMRIIFEHGDARPFESFDRYAMYETSKGKLIGDLLDEFESARMKNLEQLRAWQLSDEQLEQQGLHPGLGRVTARQLLSTWVVHDLHHIAQVCSTLAHQYRDAVGAWRAYLGILQPR